MSNLDLRGDLFKDKVLGCWIGKNCGGTLGTPVEEAWGKPEPFDIWWYPELQSGGLPNDDLEMQLVWLTALEQVGPELTATDLARYWLDHIGYNFDEYGLSKTNLRLGLQPPVSGAFNNWFVDCMGCPIRSEVWACIAPGFPRIAARYAYQDAICDHAGGESVFGELFNVAIQSSAFVVDDLDLLLDIGLSYVPETSATHRAVIAAREAHAQGLSWTEARARVLEATPSVIAQYSPINLGFQTIGWLYGDNFGDALCKTVNCGYDTDSSGGSIGSWLGIRAGMSNLPKDWIEPFGLGLSTNESWGGVRHMTDGSTPIPSDIVELTGKIVGQAERILHYHGVTVTDGRVDVNQDILFADDSIKTLWSRSPWVVSSHRPQLDVKIDYQGSAAIIPSEPRTLTVELINPHPDPITVDVHVDTPADWVAGEPITVDIPAAGKVTTELTVHAPSRSALGLRNDIAILAQPRRYPATSPTQIALIGATAWRVCVEQDGNAPEALTDRDRPSPLWREIPVPTNELPLRELLAEHSAITLQTFLKADKPEEIRLATDSSVPTTVWVNGEELISVTGSRIIRPSYGTSEEVNRVVTLTEGFNEVLIRCERASDQTPPQAHFFCSGPDKLRNGIVHLGRTRLPWD